MTSQFPKLMVQRQCCRNPQLQTVGPDGWLPGQSGYNKRLRKLAATMGWQIRVLALAAGRAARCAEPGRPTVSYGPGTLRVQRAGVRAGRLSPVV